MSLETLQVQVQGLVGKPELNGRTGVALAFDEQKERYNVKLDGGGETVSIHQKNLKKLAEQKDEEGNSAPPKQTLRERKKKPAGPPKEPSPEEILLLKKVNELVADSTKVVGGRDGWQILPEVRTTLRCAQESRCFDTCIDGAIR